MTNLQIGKKLRTTRISRHLTIRDASVKMKISPATLWKLETGKAGTIRGRTKDAISTFIGKSDDQTPQEVVQAITTPIVVNSTPKTMNQVLTTEIVEISKSLTKLVHDLQEVQDLILAMGLSKIRE